jgi:hypothetical protein
VLNDPVLNKVSQWSGRGGRRMFRVDQEFVIVFLNITHREPRFLVKSGLNSSWKRCCHTRSIRSSSSVRELRTNSVLEVMYNHSFIYLFLILFELTFSFFKSQSDFSAHLFGLAERPE